MISNGNDEKRNDERDEDGDDERDERKWKR